MSPAWCELCGTTLVKISFTLSEWWQKVLLLLLWFSGDFFAFVFLICSPLFCIVLSAFLPALQSHSSKICRNSSHHLLSSHISWPERNYSLWLCLNSEERIVMWFIVTSHTLVTLIKQPKLYPVVPNQIESPQLKNWRVFLSMANEQFAKNSL